MKTSLTAILACVVFGAGACGGGSDGKDMAAFVGVWSPTAGTTAVVCSGNTNTSAVSGNVTWSLGTSSDLIQTLTNSSCVIHADVEGETASGVGTQTCVFESTDSYTGDPLSTSISLTAYTFVISGDGHTATENFSGTLLQTDNYTGLNTSCSYSETAGSYQKD